MVPEQSGNRKVIVAIDGPAGAGKSTVARRVAERLGFLYIDSGAMYRAVALWALRAGIDLNDQVKVERLAEQARIDLVPGTSRVLLNGEDVTEAIRSSDVADAASKISTFPGVRRAMVAEQRRMAQSASVVMEGRDIGTVVFPDAQVKIYLDAAPEERARRRWLEAKARGEAREMKQMIREVQERDHRDRTRAEAPLVQAPDAVYLDSTKMGVEEVEQAVLRIVRERLSNGKEFGN